MRKKDVDFPLSLLDQIFCSQDTLKQVHPHGNTALANFKKITSLKLMVIPYFACLKILWVSKIIRLEVENVEEKKSRVKKIPTSSCRWITQIPKVFLYHGQCNLKAFYIHLIQSWVSVTCYIVGSPLLVLCAMPSRSVVSDSLQPHGL